MVKRKPTARQDAAPAAVRLGAPALRARCCRRAIWRAASFYISVDGGNITRRSRPGEGTTVLLEFDPTRPPA